MAALTFSKKVALRYLWAKRREAFISIITYISIAGVAIGVAVLNITMGIMSGFQHELRDKILGANAHINVRKLGGTIGDWEKAQIAITAVPGVESVSPYTYNQVLMRTENESSGLLIKGIHPKTAGVEQLEKYLNDSQALKNMFSGMTPAIADSTAILPGIVIGEELARTSGLFVGSSVSLISPQVSSSPFGLVPRFKRFVVAGIYRSGLVEYESGLAYVSMAEAQKFFRLRDKISAFEVRVSNIDQAQNITQQISLKLGGLGNGFYAQSWTETNKAIWDALNLEKSVYFIILLLIVVMASFSIISTLIMIVLDKRKDIAVLKTMGASTSAISNIFRIQGAVIGALGTSLGLILGLAGSIALREYGFPLDERVFQLAEVPVRIDPLNYLAVGACAFAICLFATLYPARRASQLEPSEVLRYE